VTLTVTDGLEALALDAARDLEDASAEDIVRWAADTFGDRFAVTASMSDGVLSHVAGRAVPGITVLFLDTGYHFPETIGTRDAIAATYPVNVETVTHPLRVPEHEAEYGRLYEIDPDLCCAIRKIWPLDRALRPYDAWAGGVRRAELASRADTPVVAWDAKRRKVKVNPLATWTDEQVAAYVAEHGILVNPLRQIGYTSIGCAPCTRPVADGADPRSGRWAGLAKTECGIH
jgi:phosphoadenosine phosphosulfate reductase